MRGNLLKYQRISTPYVYASQILMNTKRSFLLLLLALLTAAVLYPRQRGTWSKPQDQRQEITLWMPLSASESLQTAVEAFERENPHYKVVLGAATVRDAVSDPTRFLLGVAGGSPPDVMYFDRYAVVEWASRGAFLDLNGYLQQDRSRPDGIHSENYHRPMWEEPSYQGHQYGIPLGVDVRSLFLNDDLLVRAGLINADGTVKPPRSWEDVCRKKFHGTGSIEATRVRLGAPATMPGLGLIPTAPDGPVPGDVVTLRHGMVVFRARIAKVTSDAWLELDFTRELPPGTTRIPADFLSPDTELKLFDANSYAIRMTRYDEKGDLAVVGFIPLAGDAWLYIYGWQNGATFLSADGTRCELDQPAVKEALQFITDCYDALGGHPKIADYEFAQIGSPLHPFLAGKIAMQIDGNWFLSTISQYRPDLRFTVVPAPIPQARLNTGHQPITWAGGWAYAIPSTAKNPDGAWALMRFLTSERAIHMQTEIEAARTRGQGQLFIPGLSSDRRLLPWQRQTFLTGNPAITDRMRMAYDNFATLVPNAKYRPITPIGQKLWQAQKAALEVAIVHAEDVHEALTLRTRQVQRDLDRRLHPVTGPVVDWNWLILAYAGLIAAGFAILFYAERRHRRAGHTRRPWRAGLLCISPWLVGFLLVGAGPMLFSLVISFCRYDVLNPAQFVGLDNYRQLLSFHQDPATGQTLASDPQFWLSIGNTAFMMISVPLGIVAGLFLAMLLDQSFRGIAFFRTLFYLPSIVPAVASFLLWMWIFDPKRGLLNTTLVHAGMTHPPSWLSDPDWAKPALILMGLWGVGGGMLIWLAGLKNIPVQLYEAAEIDGAGPIRRFFHVTLPLLSPYIFFNTIMGMIGVIQVFEAAFIMTNGGPNNSTLFYAYKLFNEAFRYLDMGTASAMAWLLFVVIFALTCIQLWLGKKWVHYE